MNQCTDWHQGWWSKAQHTPSANCEARPDGEVINLVVLHNISLPPFEYETEAIAALFTNQIDGSKHPFFKQLVDLRVSAHFLITRLGKVVQFVSCDEMAYHAGVSSFRGREKCNRFSIGIEIEGCDFEPFTEIQYQVLLLLIKALQGCYPIEAITGHEHIAPSRKSDPGHFFDWNYLEKHGLPIEF